MNQALNLSENDYEPIVLAQQASFFDAIGTVNVFPHYQPIVDLRTGQVAYLESLVRWQMKKGEVLNAAQFEHVFSKTDIALKLGLVMLEKVTKDLLVAKERKWPDFGINLNVEAINFLDPQFLTNLYQTVLSKGISASKIGIEITENSYFSTENAEIMDAILRLRKRGFPILLDDFGKGFSSISHLCKIPASTLKLDRQIVTDVKKYSHRYFILEAVSQLARKLGIQTVAEGVETAHDLEMVRALNFDYAQGYYFSRPAPFSDVPRMIADIARQHNLASQTTTKPAQLRY